MKSRYILILLTFSLFKVNLLAHDQIVHEAITTSATEAAYNHSPAYVDFVNLISMDLSYTGHNGVTNEMAIGSWDEDFAGQDAGGNRSYNHFYDPLDITYGKGLSDEPPDIRAVVGTNSFAWASISNCLGYNYSGEFDFPFFGKNVNTTNIYSWQNARGYEWLGLTATNQLERQTYLADMFRAVGQVMHLVEDLSQPQHVRNEITMKG